MNKKIINIVCEQFSSNIFKMRSITDKQCIFEYYNTYSYSGAKLEFLYIPTLGEVENDLARGMIYLGIIAIDSNKVVAMQEIFQLDLFQGICESSIGFPTFAFFPPKWDTDLSDKYFAISGVYVDEKYRKQGLASALLNASMEIAKLAGAHGIYGDPNYLNHISQRVISKQFDIIGFTDGVTNGPENEQSIYVTYYHSMITKTPPVISILLNTDGFNAVEERDAMIRKFNSVGKLSKYEFTWKDGKNIVYVLDDFVVKNAISLN